MPDDAELLVVLDRRGQVARYSAAWGALGGWTPEATLGRAFTELVVLLEPSSLPALAASDAPVDWRGTLTLMPTRGGAPVTVMGHLLAKAGDAEVWLAAERAPSASCFAGPAGHLPAHPASLITPSLRAAPRAVNDQRLALILGQHPGYCYTVDAALTFTSSSGAGLRHLSLTDDQLVGTTLLDLYGTRDPSYEPLACHLRALGGAPQKYQDVCMGRSLEYHLRPLCDEMGQVIGVLGVAQDVTEREAMKEALATVHAQLRQAQKLENIGRLSGGVAHDFNNVLTCILGNLTLAQQHLPPDSPGRHHLAEASAAVDSASALTRHLLSLGRKRIVEPRPLDLGNLVERTQAILRRTLDSGVALRVAVPGEVCPVFADPSQLEQVLINLAVNARDAIAEHGEITITTTRHDCTPSCEHPVPEHGAGSYVVLTVADDGCGMSEAVRSRIFEPYFTTKPMGEGTGLGLATVLSVVQQFHGAVTVDSALGRGSTFRIYLPRLADDALPRNLAPGQRDDRSSSPEVVPHGTETILLVDDEPMVLELAQLSLQQLGYLVLACGGADDALRRFTERDRDVDLVVTDVVMPRLNGRELAARLVALKPGLPVLFTSGYGEGVVSGAGTLDPTVRFIAKPYRPSELAVKVREALDSVPVVATAVA